MSRAEQHLDEWSGIDGKGPLEPTPAQALDYDRPLIMMESTAGQIVGMYEDAPGEYWRMDGSPATEAEAQAVGFDIWAARRQRREKELRARAVAAVAELQEPQAALPPVKDLPPEVRAIAEEALAALAKRNADRAKDIKNKAEQFDYELRHVRR